MPGYVSVMHGMCMCGVGARVCLRWHTVQCGSYTIYAVYDYFQGEQY